MSDEKEMLRAAYWKGRYNSLLSAAREAVKALEPFADEVRNRPWISAVGDDTPIGGSTLTNGHLRRSVAALARLREHTA